MLYNSKCFLLFQWIRPQEKYVFNFIVYKEINLIGYLSVSNDSHFIIKMRIIE